MWCGVVHLHCQEQMKGEKHYVACDWFKHRHPDRSRDSDDH